MWSSFIRRRAPSNIWRQHFGRRGAKFGKAKEYWGERIPVEYEGLQCTKPDWFFTVHIEAVMGFMYFWILSSIYLHPYHFMGMKADKEHFEEHMSHVHYD